MLTRSTAPYWLLALMFAFASAVFSVPFWDWRTPHHLPVPRELFILILALGFALLLLLTAFDTNTRRRMLRGFMVFGVMFTGIFGSMQTQQQGQLDNVRSSPSYQRTAEMLRQTNADIQLRTEKKWGAYQHQEERADSLARALRQYEEAGEEITSPALAMAKVGLGVPATIMAGLFAALASLIIDQGTRFAAIRIRELTGAPGQGATGGGATPNWFERLRNRFRSNHGTPKKRATVQGKSGVTPATDGGATGEGATDDGRTAQLIRELWEGGNRNKSDIARRVSCSRTYVQKVVRQMAAAGEGGEGAPALMAANEKIRRNRQQRIRMLEDYLSEYPDASLNEMADAVGVSSRETVRKYLQEIEGGQSIGAAASQYSRN